MAAVQRINPVVMRLLYSPVFIMMCNLSATARDAIFAPYADGGEETLWRV